jgi:hypothetical protein
MRARHAAMRLDAKKYNGGQKSNVDRRFGVRRACS